jgi:hypothetical protein
MKHYTFFLVAVATTAGLAGLIAPAPGQSSGESAPAFATEIPHGYRDWRWISSAHEAGNLNSIGAVLGNEVAFKAYRDGKLPFPDGTIIAALHYRYVPSDENNKVFGQAQSFVPGAPTNIQFMVKDSKKYAATGVYEKLLPLPPESQCDRLCLYSLCTLMLKHLLRGPLRL